MPNFCELCKLWPQFLDQKTWQPKNTIGVSMENIEMPPKYTSYLRVPQISSSLSCCSTRSLASGQRFLIIMNSGALLLSAKGYWGPTDPDHGDLCDCPALWPFIQGFFHTRLKGVKSICRWTKLTAQTRVFAPLMMTSELLFLFPSTTCDHHWLSGLCQQSPFNFTSFILK